MEQNPFAILYTRLDAIERLILTLINHQQLPPSTENDIGGIDFAAKITGLKPSTIYCHISKKAIPHFKRGGKVYFSRSVLEKWIKEDARGSPKEFVEPIILFPRKQKK